MARILNEDFVVMAYVHHQETMLQRCREVRVGGQVIAPLSTLIPLHIAVFCWATPHRQATRAFGRPRAITSYSGVLDLKGVKAPSLAFLKVRSGCQWGRLGRARGVGWRVPRPSIT